MLDATADYIDFFFGADQSVAKIETIEISQISFSQVYRVQCHYRDGLNTTLETGESAYWQYVPMKIDRHEESGNLDYGFTVTLGDLGEIIPDEIDRAREAGTMRTNPPAVIFRAYRSDKLSAPMERAITLQAREVTRTDEGAQFNATAPELNVSGTGEQYQTDRFTMVLASL